MQEAKLSPRVDTVEAASILGIKPQTLEKWRCERTYPDLPFYRIGRKVLYARADLERWIERRKVGGDPQPA